MIVVLAGGVGAARFVRGLVRVVPPHEVTVIGNTGDDIDIYDVRVCPDLDIVTFMLAGILDEERQFGIAGDTLGLMNTLAGRGESPWFTLGDRDFGVCMIRTLMLIEGEPLHRATAAIASRLGVGARIIPMTDDRVFTAVQIRDADGSEREVHFQEYWVKRRAEDPVLGVRLDGAEHARPAPGVLEAISSADVILIAPSNPIVSIGTILAVPGIRDALRESAAPVIGVSPIIAGQVVRGMADKLLPVFEAEVSALGVASLYADFLDGFVIDRQDEKLAAPIRQLGIRTAVTQTLMRTLEDAAALAKETLALAR